jgi:hypothetical protein
MKLKHGMFAITLGTLMAAAGAASAEDSPAPSEPATTTPAPGEDTAAVPAPTPAEPAAPETEPAPVTTSPEMEPLPAPAAAAPVAPVTPIPSDRDVIPPEAQARWMPASGIGLAIMAGGGVTDFTNSGIRADTTVGGSWTARFAVATRSYVGLEASYVGGAQGINGIGLAGNSNIVRNGVEGMLRIQAPLYASNTLLEPYIAGGLGWNSYRLTNFTANTAAISDSDNTLSVPLAAGFAIGYKGFIGDLRYTYRPTYNQDIFSNLVDSELTNWDAGAMVGYEF